MKNSRVIGSLSTSTYEITKKITRCWLRTIDINSKKWNKEKPGLVLALELLSGIFAHYFLSLLNDQLSAKQNSEKSLYSKIMRCKNKWVITKHDSYLFISSITSNWRTKNNKVKLLLHHEGKKKTIPNTSWHVFFLRRL